PQQTTTLTIILLDAKSFQVPVTVKNLRQGSDQAIQLGCSFNKLDFYFLARLAQYISVKDSQNNTVKMIREAGFYIDPMLSHAYRIRYVSSRNDWEQLLQLRLLAQQTEGRMQSVTDYTLCADQHDSTSRHLMVFCGEQLVGTGRMVFNYGVVERAEHANLCPIPDFIVQAGFTENSRAATHPAFRRTMIFQYLIRYYYRIAIQENLAYMIINCEDSLVKIYQRFGGRPTGDTFYTEYMEDRRLNLIYFDVKEIASGHQLPFKIWSFIFHDKLSILKEKNIRVRSKYRILQKILNLSKKVLEYVSHLQLHKNSRLAYEKQRQKIQQGE
ncbi:MAG: GNAT family N-acetyltransferase, partial [Zetaproteobacteria bacterium]|nr:GNAT family N-acetyltransferase [Zetaproteobacteria bacterium]